MKNKSILFVAQNQARLTESAVRPLGEKEILVKTAFSTISCGTERANITGDPAISWMSTEEKVEWPRQLGYSSAGEIIDIGSAVTEFQIGDRVAMAWSKHEKYNIVPACNAIKLQNSVTYQEAALVNILTFPLAAIRKTKLEMGESALIMGLGILGLFAVALARVTGAVPIIAVDPIASRREKALMCGADYALDPTEPDFVQTVKKLSNGGAKTAIEVTGIGAGLNQCLDCMARFGRVALLGCTRKSDFTVDYYRKVHGPGITLIGAHTNARPQNDSSNGWFTQQDDMKTVIDLIAHRRLSFEKIIDQVYSPSDCQKVYTELIENREFPVISQFDWNNID